MRKHQGFSLIELLIVVAIILTIAAIAIPSLLRARIAANEASAVESLRALNTAQISYNTSYATVGFATTLGALAGVNCAPPESPSACLIDTLLASGSKSGYSFTIWGPFGNAERDLPDPGRPSVSEPEWRPLLLHVCRCGDSRRQRLADNLQLWRQPAAIDVERNRRQQ